MANIKIKFEVIAHFERSYSYDTMGNGHLEITLPEEVVGSIDPGNLFKLALESALVDMNEKIKKEEKEEE